jgi:hypothetical protein
MKWQDLLTTYWSQVTLLLLTVGYFIKRIFDNKSKKLEISYSLFQQNRINTVNNFFSNYAKVEFMWHKLPHSDILSHKMPGKEIDQIIWPQLNDLKQSVLELKMYFLANDHIYFQKLLDNLLLINGNLMDNHSYYGEEPSLIQKINDFLFFKDKILKENKKVIDDLSLMVRKSFGHK